MKRCNKIDAVKLVRWQWRLVVYKVMIVIKQLQITMYIYKMFEYREGR
jgi:hypothetical protein